VTFGAIFHGHRAIFLHKTSGVDVMIIMICDFHQFSAKKIGVFLKNQCYDPNFAKSISIWNKNADFFRQFLFGENILKIITSVPGHTGLRSRRRRR
jgi:hypothetical protein